MGTYLFPTHRPKSKRSLKKQDNRTMANPKKKPALGRGMQALLKTDEVQTAGSSTFAEISIRDIVPNPKQPRTRFDQDAMLDLASSIRNLGIIQPITVRKMSDGRYQIISGERRYRAAKLANVSEIPAYIRTAEDEEVSQMALVENLQREDLNAIEIALAYQALIDSQHLTQEQMSELVGKKRATVTNYLRLLKLPAEIQSGITEKKIDMAHARAILGAVDPLKQIELYNKTLEEHLSVREVERMVSRLNKENGGKPRKSKAPLPEDYEQLRTELSEAYGQDIDITCKKSGGGRITLQFQSKDDLIALLNRLK